MNDDIITKRLSNLKYLFALKKSNITATSKKNIYGDIVKFYAQINKEDTIQKISYKASGCSHFIAVCSYFCEIIEGKSVKDALKINKKDLQKFGLFPENRDHIYSIILDTFALLIKKYRKGVEQNTIIPTEVDNLDSEINKTSTKSKLKNDNSKQSNNIEKIETTKVSADFSSIESRAFNMDTTNNGETTKHTFSNKGKKTKNSLLKTDKTSEENEDKSSLLQKSKIKEKTKKEKIKSNGKGKKNKELDLDYDAGESSKERVLENNLKSNNIEVTQEDTPSTTKSVDLAVVNESNAIEVNEIEPAAIEVVPNNQPKVIIEHFETRRRVEKVTTSDGDSLIHKDEHLKALKVNMPTNRNASISNLNNMISNLHNDSTISQVETHSAKTINTNDIANRLNSISAMRNNLQELKNSKESTIETKDTKKAKKHKWFGR